MKTKIYHNPRCSKSRQTLDLLKDKTDQIEIIEYLKNPPDKKTISEILHKLNISAEMIIRKKDDLFKEKFANKKMTDEDYLQALVDFPALLERPIVIKGNKAVLGRPPENIDKLF